MTKPCYLFGCAVAPQVCGLAFWSASPNVGSSNNAWNVNFNNGNVNNNNRNNNNHVRLVRASEWSVIPKVGNSLSSYELEKLTPPKASQGFSHPKGVGNPHPTSWLGGLTPQ